MVTDAILCIGDGVWLKTFYELLHWLPVWYRIDYKILLFVNKALNNLAPKCFSDLIVQSFQITQIPK